MTSTRRALPDYGNPPLVEVVCGVVFEPITKMLVPHFGLLWEEFKADYPVCQEAPPLVALVESFDKSSPMSVPAGNVLQFAEIPPLPRVGFVHATGSRVIQVQRDRFLHNWRKTRAEDEYPRYKNVLRMFRDHLSCFESFIARSELGAVIPKQYEITYLNHIPQGDGWMAPSDIGKVFPDFAWRLKAQRFFPEFENTNWQTTFVLPNQSGRMYATIRQVTRSDNQEPLLLLDLTVRGVGKDTSPDAMWDWFDMAHEWIVRGFADLTSENEQKEVWRRKR